jgi:hypothetical protein
MGCRLILFVSRMWLGPALHFLVCVSGILSGEGEIDLIWAHLIVHPQNGYCAVDSCWFLGTINLHLEI